MEPENKPEHYRCVAGDDFRIDTNTLIRIKRIGKKTVTVYVNSPFLAVELVTLKQKKKIEAEAKAAQKLALRQEREQGWDYYLRPLLERGEP